MSASQPYLFLSLFLFTLVYADYVVYPRIRNNLRLNAGITDSIISLLGAENVQTYSSRPRQVYEFWLIKATASQAAVVKNVVGVSLFMPMRIGTACITDLEMALVGRRNPGE